MKGKANTKAQWEHVGDIPVDSGKVMLVDPVLLNRMWQKREFSPMRQFRHEATGRVLQFGYDFSHFDEVIPDLGQSMSQLLATGEWEAVPEKAAPEEMSYHAACVAMINGRGAGMFGGFPHPLAAVASTGSDGGFPMYVERDASGRILRMMVDFTGEDEQEPV